MSASGSGKIIFCSFCYGESSSGIGQISARLSSFRSTTPQDASRVSKQDEIDSEKQSCINELNEAPALDPFCDRVSGGGDALVGKGDLLAHS